jgi:3-phenylpropionate/cinnamic acid dioxygenase small subunit
MSGHIDTAAQAQIEDLLARYNHTLDNDALEDWPSFFVEGGQYLVTTRDNHMKGQPIGLIYCDGVGMMQDRITGLRQAIVFEPHVYRHIVGSILIAPAPDGSYAAESNFHILRTSADGTTITYGSGRYLDEIVMQGGKMRFRKRTVVLDSSRIDTLLVIPL